jgi:predicted adenylyl cyclase CyaB
MARNIEIKARVAQLDSLVAKVTPLATSGPEHIFQDDTFFECPQGRLKLRMFSTVAGELIFYRRANQTGPKESFYVRSPTASPESLREALTLAFGATGRVIKDRIVYMVGRTRVHLDTVQGLGMFMELEVVLQGEDTAEQGVQEAHALMQQLGVAQEHLEARAYVDLLRGKE